MNIHQLSVHHEERQDRLLLRLNTKDQQEFRFWLTRRMTLRLLPAIEKTAVRLGHTAVWVLLGAKVVSRGFRMASGPPVFQLGCPFPRAYCRA